MTDEIAFEIQGSVASITLNRPDQQNRLAAEHLERLGQIVAEIESSEVIHAVLVTGAGTEFFSAGLLNPEIRAALPKEEVLEIVFLANRIFDALEALPQITIAAVNGAVMAGAVELALACDIRLVADHATLMLPEATWGGFPGAGAPLRLPMTVGYGRALELICTGRQIDAEEMEKIGFAEFVYPGDVLGQQAMNLADKIAASGPLATRGAKQIARARRAPGFHESRELSDELRRALEYSADVDEGIAAHRESRRPKFTGR